MDWPLLTGGMLILGLGVGAMVGWFLARGRSAYEAAGSLSSSIAEVAATKARAQEFSTRIAELQNAGDQKDRLVGELQSELTRLKQDEARLEAELSAERKGTATRLEEFNARFDLVSSDLRVRQQDFEHARIELAGLKEERARLLTELANERESAADKLKELARLNGQVEQALHSRERELEETRRQIAELKDELSRLTHALDAERRVSTEKLALLQQAESRLQDAFSSLSAEALRQNTRSFLDLAGEYLGDLQQQTREDLSGRQQVIQDLVAPLKDLLQQVDSRLGEVERQHVQVGDALGDQLRLLASTQEALQNETSALAGALRGPAQAGSWGELQLRRVVEMAGMLEHCDFDWRACRNEDGTVGGPEVVVHLPGNRTVVVDTRVPLAAYTSAFETDDPRLRDERLNQHAAAVREHIGRLGGRAYWAQFESEPEFIFMFLPGESFLSAALERDGSLIEYGVRRGVIPASPLTLLALLRAVAFGWRQERLAEEAASVRAIGRDLYDRIHEMSEQWDEVAASLSRTVEAYNHAIGSLENRVLVSARQLRDLGAGTAESIPNLDPIDRQPRAMRAVEPVAARTLSIAAAAEEQEVERAEP
ncbi:MAG: DNA recombination protein RmuC [Acidobacteria bacterium]|nr:DNA recombination protein RmuC [Acidobacteriota bacterium]